MTHINIVLIILCREESRIHHGPNSCTDREKDGSVAMDPVALTPALSECKSVPKVVLPWPAWVSVGQEEGGNHMSGLSKTEPIRGTADWADHRIYYSLYYFPLYVLSLHFCPA